MPGLRVDVGGYKLHINCTGQGTPMVVLDSGFGDSYVSWMKVQPQIAKFTRVCSYDRAGLGYSDSSPLPRSTKGWRRSSARFCTMLELIHLTFWLDTQGGYNVRLFASLYRSEVAGMVLGVDSSHPEQEKRFPQALNEMEGICRWRSGENVQKHQNSFQLRSAGE